MGDSGVMRRTREVSPFQRRIEDVAPLHMPLPAAVGRGRLLARFLQGIGQDQELVVASGKAS